MPADRYTRTETFPGIRIDHFRALMQHLLREGWTSATGERLLISEKRQTRRELVAVSPSSVRSLLGEPMVNRDYRDIDVTPPTRGSWAVVSLDAGHQWAYAGIEAYEGPSELLRVDFIDGYDPEAPNLESEAIGNTFWELCDMLIGETRILQIEDQISDLDDQSCRSREDIECDRVIIRCFYEGTKYRLIGNAAGVSEETVKRRLRKFGLGRRKKRS